jgi:CheY-like chemotaxis protein
MALPEEVPPEETKPTKRPLALVVDDDADTRASLAELLADHGFQVLAVEDGQKAVDLLEREPTPDVVVLDLWMPVMDGWTVAKRVMARELPSVPIIVVTAAGAHFAYPVSSRYVLRKPIDSDRFLRLVSEIVTKP